MSPRRSSRLKTRASPAKDEEDAGFRVDNTHAVHPPRTDRLDVTAVNETWSTSRAISHQNSQRGDAAIAGRELVQHVLRPLSKEERVNWPGWCEVESEPAFFNVMLREFGVQGIKVQEIFSLDDDMLAHLPKPVYGLIFLFQFREDDPTKQESKCPETVWFANQTVSNACASIALLNVIMNIPDVEIGSGMRSLKDFTTHMHPAHRGYTVSKHKIVRSVHNSFARRMDMLNADLTLSNEVKAAKNQGKRKTSKKKEPENEPGFHFSAFVPIKGNVYKLDGLDRQPMILGKFEDGWLNLVRPILEERMAQYEGEQIQFNLLSLCRSPTLSLPEMLAMSAYTLMIIEAQLNDVQPDWRDFVDGLILNSCIRGPDVNFAVTQEALDLAVAPHISEISAEALLDAWRDECTSQERLRRTFLEETGSIEQDAARANSRRHDYTPMVYRWIHMLAENGVLKSLVATGESW